MYVIKCWNEEEEFYKIGRTFCTLKRRFDSKKDIPYEYKVQKIFNGSAEEIYNLETKLKRENKHSVMRTPMQANPEDRSIVFAGSLPEGSKVRLCLLPGFEVVDEA